MKHVWLLLAGILVSFSLNAQEVTAGIYGTVLDSTSSAVPSAAITLHNVDTGRDYQATSDDSGNFALTLIPIGNYEVYGVASGFKKATVTGVTLAVNDKRRIDFRLEVGAVTESVMVSADLIAVNTANGSTSAVVTNHTLINLPSTTRAVLPFALLMPGAVSTTPTSATANNTSVNGVRSTHNAWVLDGGYELTAFAPLTTPGFSTEGTTSTPAAIGGFCWLRIWRSWRRSARSEGTIALNSAPAAAASLT